MRIRVPDLLHTLSVFTEAASAIGSIEGYALVALAVPVILIPIGLIAPYLFPNRLSWFVSPGRDGIQRQELDEVGAREEQRGDGSRDPLGVRMCSHGDIPRDVS